MRIQWIPVLPLMINLFLTGCMGKSTSVEFTGKKGFEKIHRESEGFHFYIEAYYTVKTDGKRSANPHLVVNQVRIDKGPAPSVLPKALLEKKGIATLLNLSGKVLGTYYYKVGKFPAKPGHYVRFKVVIPYNKDAAFIVLEEPEKKLVSRYQIRY